MKQKYERGKSLQLVLNRQYFENDYTKDEKKGSHVERTERQEMYECQNYYII
jgi:hypothetical protein